MEDKQQILTSGVEKDRVKDIMTPRKHMNRLKENDNNVKNEKRIQNKLSECKKMSFQDHEFPAKNQKQALLALFVANPFIRKLI